MGSNPTTRTSKELGTMIKHEDYNSDVYGLDQAEFERTMKIIQNEYANIMMEYTRYDTLLINHHIIPKSPFYRNIKAHGIYSEKVLTGFERHYKTHIGGVMTVKKELVNDEAKFVVFLIDTYIQTNGKGSVDSFDLLKSEWYKSRPYTGI